MPAITVTHPRRPFARPLATLAVGLLAVHVAHDATGFGARAFDTAFALWFQPIVFAGCGLATLWRAVAAREERLPWALLGTGLLLYGLGSVFFNLVYGDDPSPPFPSLADGLWLTLYPLSLAAIALLTRRRFMRLGTTVWLDAAIGGTVVAALAAALVFEPVFAVTVASGAASVARLGYPLGDLACVSFVAVVWSLCGGRFDAFWALLGSGFALLALGDSVYVVEAARGTWAPGGLLDLPYALGTVLLAAAAWSAPREPRPRRDTSARGPALPVAFALAALGLTAYDVAFGLNPLAGALSLLALLAVVVRFGLTLARLTRQRAALAALADTDPLTGLANHRRLHERLEDEVARARRYRRALSVVALDIDHFKAINDTYGHAEGDAALQAIAATLTAQSRRYDVLGRIGGEEFVLLLPDADGEEALAIAERCRAALADVTVQGTPVSCSGGVASYPADDPDGQRLLELADGALYWAKRSGRAQVRRFDAREVVLLSSAEQQAQIRAVLADPDGIVPVFQPLVELATGRIGGYEALARFTAVQPVRPPDQWFAQARRCGLGGALEARAIAAALAVPGRPAGTFLALNLSPGALAAPEVAAVLPGDLSDVVIELTEDELFSADAALDLALADLRARGARIAVDDAGAGYAGLQQVIRVKPEILKLDRSLIDGIHGDPARIALLEALASFATSTGAAVCAEGVEDAEDLRTLARFDVTYAQGYALARPGPAWPAVASEAVGHAASELRWGMRLAPTPTSELFDRLGRVRSRGDLRDALELAREVAHADEAAVSSVAWDEGALLTLSEHDWAPTGERYAIADYPTTARVLADQACGQIVVGDAAADPAELAFLEHYGFGAVLMAPIVFRGQTVGLLELYRRTARPWTPGEIDEARALALHLGTALPNPVASQA